MMEIKTLALVLKSNSIDEIEYFKGSVSQGEFCDATNRLVEELTNGLKDSKKIH